MNIFFLRIKYENKRGTGSISEQPKKFLQHLNDIDLILYSLFCNRITFIVDENVDVPFEYCLHSYLPELFSSLQDIHL